MMATTVIHAGDGRLRLHVPDLLDNETLARQLERRHLASTQRRAGLLPRLQRQYRPDAVPVLAQHLTHPYPLVRGYAKRALDAIQGAPVPIDIDAADAVIEEQAKALH